MDPVNPDIEGFPELALGKGQEEEYGTLPAALAYNSDGDFILVTRWRLTEAERAAVAAGGDIFLTVLTFGQPLQPVMLGTAPPHSVCGLSVYRSAHAARSRCSNYPAVRHIFVRSAAALRQHSLIVG